MIEEHSEPVPAGSPSPVPDSPVLTTAAPAYPTHPHFLAMPGGITPPQTLVLFGIRWGKPSAAATRVLLIAGVMLSYSLFFILQESIFKREKCEYAGFVSLVHFCMFWVFGMIERVTTNDPIPRRGPVWYHVKVAFFCVAGFTLSTYSLQLLNFPTWSGRVVATMIGGIILLQKRYTAVEYFGVFCIAIGLAVCTFADFSVLPTFNVPGLFLVILALVMNAMQDNSQEKGMKELGVPENELVVYSYGIGVVMLLPFLLLNGEFMLAVSFLSTKYMVIVQILVAGVLAYLGTVFVLALLSRTSALVTVITTSCRKAFSVFLSFLIFSKPFTITYLLGTGLVFFGVVTQIYIKNRPTQEQPSSHRQEGKLVS